MKHPVVIHDATRNGWLWFENPVRIVEARTSGQVLPALRELECDVNRHNLFAAGFLSYEAAPAFDAALSVRPDTSGFPLLWFGLYPPPRKCHSLPPLIQAPLTPPPAVPWTPSLSRQEYENTLTRLRQYLFAGDTYQVNYTFRLSSSLRIHPGSLFWNLVAAQGAHYAAFVDTGDNAVCSASPELFFRLDGDRLESRPMKGTIQRGRTTVEDRRQAEILRASVKNQAENVMIVDMIRNDMGRIAIPGTVEAGPLFDVERYPTVWQMVSTVTARTHASVSDILTALFPCASITGAPKPRTMKIIAAEETTPRRIYTGTIGYLAPGRQAQFSVAIRTVLVNQQLGLAEYGVGGGIVWDSKSGDEYDECWLKARILTEKQPVFDLLETLLWTPDEGFFLLERHLKRLGESADYFDFPLDLPEVRRVLDRHVSALAPRSALRVRLLVSREGRINIESATMHPTVTPAPVRVRLSASPVDPADRFLYHKTTHREVYEKAKEGVADCDDVLLWNADGEVTESTIATIVVELNGKRVTPPVSCGLLPGTYREELLEQGLITEAVIRIEDLAHQPKIWLVNSVRRWREAVLLTSPSSD